ncbi:MAG: glycosyl hydrolase, partial [Acidobacteriota bacterium]
MPFLRSVPLLLAVLALGATSVLADATADTPDHPVDPALLESLEWRELGPFRGGRSAAVAGIPNDRDTYYFGATGGGVWKTDDAGRAWRNVSDGFFGGSIGSVAVSAWDPNVIYVGTGEKTVRGNVSHGDGVWKSVDAGATWSHVGLGDSRHVPRVRIHPRDPDVAWVCALGHLFGPNEERGVFKTTDGGATWTKVHYVSEHAGCVDLALDPTNPRHLYATFWRVLRTPWSLESGGEGSTMWKSTDGGTTWTELTTNPGLPDGTLGIMGITVSPSDPTNLYAIVEAEDGGVFRSRDAGATWAKTNAQRALRQRAWYYTRIYADPTDAESVYVVNVRFHHSKDGGKSFSQIDTPHGDNHDLWIDPNDPQRMIQSNDGGANVSNDGGTTWTTQANQPTAQMYRVSTDNAFPYRVLGGQQDNSSVRVRTRAFEGGAIGVRDWEPSAGCECGHMAAKPDDPDLVFGGCYGGQIERM